jgi:hypothetical protein
MARPGPETQAKRQREYAKKEKRRAKDQKRATRKAAKAASVEVGGDATGVQSSGDSRTSSHDGLS